MIYFFVIGRSCQVLFDVLVQFVELEVVLLYFVFILADLFCEFVEKGLSFDCELVEGVRVGVQLFASGCVVRLGGEGTLGLVESCSRVLFVWVWMFVHGCSQKIMQKVANNTAEGHIGEIAILRVLEGPGTRWVKRWPKTGGSFVHSVYCFVAADSNKIIMKVKRSIELETTVNSPTRSRQGAQDSTFTKSHLMLNSTRRSTVQLSDTEQDMFSHSLIRSVMEASKMRSVEHDINRIEDGTQLYARPIKRNKDEFKFDCMPARNKAYASSCYDKVKEIKHGLNEQPISKEGRRPGAERQTSLNRPLSAASRVNTRNTKVSVSGLVNYNFSSVNARKSVGFSKINHDQKLVDTLKAQSLRQYCGSQRENKILAKTSTRRYTKHFKNQQIIMRDTMTATEKYLKEVIKSGEENTLIYDERAKKLNYIKEYMESEEVGYEEAALVVNQIEAMDSRPKQKAVLKEEPQTEAKDELLLLGRRVPRQSKPLVLRQLHFIE